MEQIVIQWVATGKPEGEPQRNGGQSPLKRGPHRGLLLETLREVGTKTLSE